MAEDAWPKWRGAKHLELEDGGREFRVLINAIISLFLQGMWDYDRFEGDGKLVTNDYTFRGAFSEQEPIGDGMYTFNNNCAQHGEYIMNRSVKFIQGEFMEVFTPKWFCTALAAAGAPREKNILLT